MVSLKESLFDDDLVSKPIIFGDLYDIDEWGGTPSDLNGANQRLNMFCDYNKMKKILDKDSKWKKFIKWTSPEKINWRDYNHDGLLYLFTQIIMSCSTEDEMAKKLNEFILEGTNNWLESNPLFIEVKTLQQPRENEIRMVVLRLKMFGSKTNYVFWLTLNKKD